jgi:hypothetical protein
VIDRIAQRFFDRLMQAKLLTFALWINAVGRWADLLGLDFRSQQMQSHGLAPSLFSLLSFLYHFYQLTNNHTDDTGLQPAASRRPLRACG